jgi:cytochrome P450
MLGGLIDKRRGDPGDDLLGRLAGGVAAGDVDEGEAIGAAMLLVLAGFETTTSLLSTAVAALLDTPGAWAWLGEDPQARAPGVVQEALRYDPPVRYTARCPHVDVEPAGEPIAADTPVLLALNAAGRDPAVHSDPHVFDPARTTASKHLAFGGGAHYCLGAALALLEAEIVLAVLASQAPGLARAGAGSRWNSALLGGFRSLPLRG